MIEVHPLEPTRDNARRIAEISHEVFAPYLSPRDVADFAPDNVRRLEQVLGNLRLAHNPDTPRVYLGASYEGRVLGYAYFNRWDPAHQTPFEERGLLGSLAHHFAHRRRFGIHSIGVEGSSRGYGVGSALVATALEQRPRHVTNVALPLWDGELCRFFAKRRFTEIGRGAIALAQHSPAIPHVLMQRSGKR